MDPPAREKTSGLVRLQCCVRERETMLFSVVIPVYNAEKYLEECLDSLLQQSYSNWEAIIVDDGSKDISGAIADSYNAKDARFKIIHKENAGQMKARMDGIRAASGDVIMFLDSDDWWAADCLEKLAEIFENDAIDMVFFSAHVVDTQGKYLRLISRIAQQSVEIDKKSIYESVLSSHALNALWSKAFRKSLFDMEALNKVVEMGARLAEDKLMLLPLITKAETVYYLDEVLYFYRHYAESISHKRHVSGIPAMIAKPVFAEVYRYMRSWNMDEKVYRRRLEIYYLRNLMDCYYAVRRSCTTKEEMKQFHQYPWKAELKNRFAKYLLGVGLTPKEKLKLLLMRISL